jgi:hypothetical protein
MAFTTPGTAVAGAVLTSDFWNTNVRDNVSFLRTPPACRVERTTNLTGYAGGTSAIGWSSAAYETGGVTWNGTNRIIVSEAGIYLVTFKGRLECTATLTAAAPQVRINGNVAMNNLHPSESSTVSNFTLSACLTLAANDEIEARVAPVGGSAYIIIGTTLSERIQRTHLEVRWVSPIP